MAGNFINLLFITAGAVQTTGEMGQMRSGEGNAISIDGARPESNNYTLDGITNTDTALQTPAVILFTGCDPGIQGAERNLLCRVRFQREPGQPDQQEWDQPVYGTVLSLTGTMLMMRGSYFPDDDPRTETKPVRLRVGRSDLDS